MKASSEKAELAKEEKTKFEKMAKEAVNESKRLSVSKQTIEKQFVFDLKKAEKRTASMRGKKSNTS